MPELPEVETVARQLAQLISGRKVKGITVRDEKLRGPEFVQLTGYTVKTVERVGKRVVLSFTGSGEKPPLWVSVHLRMTGRLIWCPDDAPERSCEDMYAHRRAVTEKSLRLTFALSGGELRFHDARRFGMVLLHETPPAGDQAALEPLSDAFTAARLAELLSGARGEIKPWLMRQDKLAGIGNIYASEILFDAGIDPRRSGGSLDAAEVRRVHRSTVKILRLAIKYCGTTFSDFQDAGGKQGKFQKLLKVYKKEGSPCPTCGGAIERIVQQQRSTFYCSACQH
jgi:formamidopyrimidine-DNA glycosylase